MSDFKVTINYKNEELETVAQKEYSFIDYTDLLNLELKKILTDVEDAFYVFSGGKQKKDWDPEFTERFLKIRHKILDQANAIKRLPMNLTYKGIRGSSMPLSEFIARELRSK